MQTLFTPLICGGCSLPDDVSSTKNPSLICMAILQWGIFMLRTCKVLQSLRLDHKLMEKGKLTIRIEYHPLQPPFFIVMTSDHSMKKKTFPLSAIKYPFNPNIYS